MPRAPRGGKGGDTTLNTALNTGNPNGKRNGKRADTGGTINKKDATKGTQSQSNNVYCYCLSLLLLLFLVGCGRPIVCLLLAACVHTVFPQ